MSLHFAKVLSAQPAFPHPHLVTVEADLSRGLHSFAIVGLPDKAVEEARDRVCAAIKHSGFTSPKQSGQRVIVSLAPSDLKKEGAIFDLAIALAYLSAAEEVFFVPDGKLFLGELSLDGNVRPVRGVLAVARYARDQGFTELYVPADNAEEAALVEGITVYGVRTLRELAEHFDEEAPFSLVPHPITVVTFTPASSLIDFREVRGQEGAKRGLEIAAAGRHNIVLYGPPGTGKTMLARAFCGVLPPLSFEEALEVTEIHSVAGTLHDVLVMHAPFRAPHHTSSHVSLVGGGAIPKPGEVTLAHRGVLFLDEFPEFERRTIDALRQPLEDKTVSVSRAKGSVVFPANFILIAAMNPSHGHGKDAEYVTEHDRMRYQKKISGPIVDRIDMWIEVAHVDHEKLSGTEKGEPSEAIRERVTAARARQTARFQNESKTNNDMSVRELEELAHLTVGAQDILNQSAKALDLSPRSFHRTIKLARTIADLNAHDSIEESDILEALQYRPRELFG